MGDFKPSSNFVTRIMGDIRAYETAMSHERERTSAFPLSKPALAALSAGGILLGIFNLVRIAFILISPALCL